MILSSNTSRANRNNIKNKHSFNHARDSGVLQYARRRDIKNATIIRTSYKLHLHYKATHSHCPDQRQTKIHVQLLVLWQHVHNLGTIEGLEQRNLRLARNRIEQWLMVVVKLGKCMYIQLFVGDRCSLQPIYNNESSGH